MLQVREKWKCWLLSCVWLFCNPMDYSPLGSSVHGIFQARILEWIAISSSRWPSWPRDWTLVSCISSRLFTVWATAEAQMITWYKVYNSKASNVNSGSHLLTVNSCCMALYILSHLPCMVYYHWNLQTSIFQGWANISQKGLDCNTLVKNPPPVQEMQETRVKSLGWDDPLE